MEHWILSFMDVYSNITYAITMGRGDYTFYYEISEINKFRVGIANEAEIADYGSVDKIFKKASQSF